jgi:ABC-2 type transport system ATP-binding protein
MENLKLNDASAPTAAVEAGPAIVCRGLVKRYGEVRAVDGLDLEIRAGECFGLLGPNGAGKTTTVEIFEGLTRPDEGEVLVLGRRWGAGDQALRERLGIQLQATQFEDKLTVTETLRLFRSFYRRGRSVEEAITLAELADKATARVGKLSGGQKQRLALASALVSDPEILFLDEPTTGLDPQARLHIWEIISRFHEAGGTVVLTTHYMEEAERLCGRVAIMDRGRGIALGSPAELINSLGADQVIRFRVSAELDRDLLLSLPGATRLTRQDGDYLLGAASASETMPALVRLLEGRGVGLLNLVTHRATLEDVFIAYTGRALRDE